MLGWDRPKPDLVVGRFGTEEIDFLRDRIHLLRSLAADRLANCPRLRPFGSGVDIEITAALPDDERVLRLLEKFLRAHPRQTWTWHELEFWRETVASCDICLDYLPISGGRLELPARLGPMFQGMLSAIVVLTLPRDHARPERFAWSPRYEWLRRTGIGLHEVISTPTPAD